MSNDYKYASRILLDMLVIITLLACTGWVTFPVCIRPTLWIWTNLYHHILIAQVAT